MSVKSEIDRISSCVADTYEVLEGLGATMPSKRNANNLAATADTLLRTNLMFVTSNQSIPIGSLQFTEN